MSSEYAGNCAACSNPLTREEGAKRYRVLRADGAAVEFRLCDGCVKEAGRNEEARIEVMRRAAPELHESD